MTTKIERKPRLFLVEGICVAIVEHDNEFSEHIELGKTNWQEDGIGFGVE